VSIPVALSPYAIIGLDEVREFLNLAPSDSSHDDFLTRQINKVTATIEATIRGPIVARDIPDEIYDGDGTTTLWVDKKPMIGFLYGLDKTFDQQLSNIQWRSSAIDSWHNMSSLHPEFYLFNPLTPFSIDLYGYIFVNVRRGIKICYRAGYEEVPGEISNVALEMVADMFQKSSRGGSRFGLRSISTGGMASGTTSYNDLNDKHMEILHQYIMPVKTNCSSPGRYW
jgi:hypothetical protein